VRFPALKTARSLIQIMSIASCVNVVALSIGTLAALIMAFYPPRVRVFGAKGEEYGQFVNNPNPKNKGRGKRQVFLSQFGPWLLAIAFLLQLIAIFLPPS
jgi:hypothetical protein